MKYLEQIATEGFFALTGSLDLTEHHIKSFPKVTPSKGPNLHKLKMYYVPFYAKLDNSQISGPCISIN